MLWGRPRSTVRGATLPPTNAIYAAMVGFKTNWDLSGTLMPYDGLFSPYQDTWENLGPINPVLRQCSVTYAQIQGFYESVQAAGRNVLTYFDVGNWSVSIDVTEAWPNVTCGARAAGGPAPCPTQEGSNAFLQHFLMDALLQHGWSVARGWFDTPFSDWVGTADMDQAVPFFEDLLVEQLLAWRLALVPAAQGIAIDRFDYSQYYSFDAVRRAAYWCVHWMSSYPCTTG